MKIPNPFKRKKKKVGTSVKVITDRFSKPKEDHQHAWELVAKTYAPPIRSAVNPTATSVSEVSERAQFGVTSLLFQCSLCKNFNKEEMLGSDIDTLDDMLGKAENYGPQLVQRPNNEVFIIQKYQNPNAIPVR